MNLEKISPKVKTLWRFRNLCWAALTGAGLWLLLPVQPVLDALLLGIWAAMAVWFLVLPGLQYNCYAYGYDDKRLYLRWGLIFRHEITAPICQIQDLQFYEGPVMRLLGLGKIDFATGGSNFELAGLDRDVARSVVEDVEARLRHRIEVRGDEEI